MQKQDINIIAISGSLRSASSNTALLRAAADLAPENVKITIYEGLDKLPYFSPELDGEGAIPPPTVAALRQQIKTADAVLFCTPEYAFGMPGVLKNALDWLVSSGEFVDKPTAGDQRISAGHRRRQSPCFAGTNTYSNDCQHHSRLQTDHPTDTHKTGYRWKDHRS